jgi:hypothetical protein
MLDAATVVDPTLERRDEARGQDPDRRQIPRGDSASNLTPQRSAAENEIWTKGSCAMSSSIEMRMIELKTGAKNETALSKSDTTKETMITMLASMISLTDNVPHKEDAMKEGLKLSPMT